MDIVLKSNRLMVDKILKKTNAKMFKDIKVGDIILISIKVDVVGRNRGTYASYMEIENLTTSEYTTKTFNELPRILDCFEFIECR